VLNSALSSSPLWSPSFRTANAKRGSLARAAVEPLIALDSQAIVVPPSATSYEVFLRYRGLPIARWDDGKVFFGHHDLREELTPATRPAL